MLNRLLDELAEGSMKISTVTITTLTLLGFAAIVCAADSPKIAKSAENTATRATSASTVSAKTGTQAAPTTGAQKMVNESTTEAKDTSSLASAREKSTLHVRMAYINCLKTGRTCEAEKAAVMKDSKAP